MRVLSSIVIAILLVCLGGCSNAVPADVRALAAYQNVKPGTPVAIVLRIGVSVDGVETPALEPKFEQEGTLAWITKDTVTLTTMRDGRPVNRSYAGRMIREIRLVKKEPNKAPLLTPASSTPAAGAPVAPPPGAAGL